MSNLTLFKNNDNKMPALSGYVDPMAELVLPSGTSHPRISIKNGRFTICKDKEENTLDAMSLLAVIIGVNPTDHRAWYEKTWSKDAEPTSPDCWSADDKTPSPTCAKPQSQSCTTCMHNAWGSSRKEGGGKDCGSHRRIVVVAESDEAGDQFIINLPATSIKEFGVYRKALVKKEALFQRVYTKISFDPNAVGKLMFDAVGWVPDELFLPTVAPRVMDESVLDALDVSYSAQSAPAAEEPEGMITEVPAKPAAKTPSKPKSPAVEANVPPPVKASGFGGGSKAQTSAAPAPTVEVASSGGIADVEAALDGLLFGKSDA